METKTWKGRDVRSERRPGRLREPRAAGVDSRLLTEPFRLVLDLVLFLLALLYFPLRSLARRLSTVQEESLLRKVALVTGSGGLLGRQICLRLAQEGCSLCLVDLDEGSNMETLRQLVQRGAVASAFTLRAANRKECDELVKRIETEVGPIYLLVNCSLLHKSDRTTEEESLKNLFHTDILGAIWMTEAVVGGMVERRAGRLAFVSSTAALHGALGSGTEHQRGTASAALSSYAQSLRLQLALREDGAGRRLTVTCTHPILACLDNTLGKSRSEEEDYLERVASHLVRGVRRHEGDICPHLGLFTLISILRFLPVEVTEEVMRL